MNLDLVMVVPKNLHEGQGRIIIILFHGRSLIKRKVLGDRNKDVFTVLGFNTQESRSREPELEFAFLFRCLSFTSANPNL